MYWIHSRSHLWFLRRSIISRQTHTTVLARRIVLVLPPPACPFRRWLWQGYLLPLGPTTELASAKLRFQERAFSQIGKVFPGIHLSEDSLTERWQYLTGYFWMGKVQEGRMLLGWLIIGFDLISSWILCVWWSQMLKKWLCNKDIKYV